LKEKCQNELNVAGIWVGLAVVAEGWTITHHEGILEAQDELGYINYDYAEEILATSSHADAVVESFINPTNPNKKPAKVIIANSLDHTQHVKRWSQQYPDVTFLHCSGKANNTNVASFYGRMEHAMYVAGRVGAKKARVSPETGKKHLGFVGSFITAEIIRHINAFTLGARHESPDAQVEVRWLGFWYDVNFDDHEWKYTPLHMGEGATEQDLSGEEYLAAKLIDSGADVIMHNLDNQLVPGYIHKHITDGTLKNWKDNFKDFDVWSIASDNIYGYLDENKNPYANTIGSAYWKWGPAYADMFDAIHRGQFQPIDYMYPLTSNTDPNVVGFDRVSVVGFSKSPVYSGIDNIALKRMIDDVAPKIGETDNKPIFLIDDREINDQEWRSMCWFVPGVVERRNPNDPTSPLDDARVPSAQYVGKQGAKKVPPEGTPRQPTTTPEVLFSFVEEHPEVMWNCDINSAGAQ